MAEIIKPLITLIKPLKTDLGKIDINSSIVLKTSSVSRKVSERKFHLLI